MAMKINELVKWYEEPELDNSIVLSSRVRLARNLKAYPFPNIMTQEQANDLIKDVSGAIYNNKNDFEKELVFIGLNEIPEVERFSLLENHVISKELLDKKIPAGILTNGDNSAGVMINEEDHIRIQSVLPGYNIDGAFENANKLDDVIDKELEYAFDEEYGYLTTCVTNTGTGLRASFMMHLPMLERTGQLRNISYAIGKFGMTLRGIYGEGSEPIGNIYQISNQITLGKNEKEIIDALKSITNQIIERETMVRQNIVANNGIEFTDNLYRSYGLLKYCKRISTDESMKLLSDVRLGIMMGIINEVKPKTNIFNIMINIQPANLMKRINKNCTSLERDFERAKYINEMFN